MRAPQLGIDAGDGWIVARWEPARPSLRLRAEDPAPAASEYRVERMPLSDALAEAAARFPEKGSRLRPTQLQVRLGMAHARVGLMHLAKGNGARLGAAALETYVTAWTRQALHLDPAQHVLRWQVLRDPHHVLVTCFKKETFETLSGFAQERGLRFTSCMPALLQQVHSVARSATHTVAWTEGAAEGRTASVQLLRFVDGQLVSTWRGWLPPSVARCADHELDGAVRRFNARHGEFAGEAVRAHWPAAGS